MASDTGDAIADAGIKVGEFFDETEAAGGCTKQCCR